MTGPFPTLQPSDLPAIARLCAAGLDDAPTVDDLAASLFTDGWPVTVRGDPEHGVVASCVREGGAALRLLVVHPAARGHGLGRALLRAAEADLGDSSSITVGADAPDYLFPGVEVTQTAMLCLLERSRYVRGEANFNMVVDLERLPAPDPEVSVAGSGESGEVDEWVTRHWPMWREEVLRCLARDRLMVARDGEGVVACCCWDGARAGWVGPVAVRPSVIGQGRGRGVLVGALHRLRAAGRHRAEIGWVGPIVPYAQTVGARIHRVFLVYRKPRANATPGRAPGTPSGQPWTEGARPRAGGATRPTH
ncbi:MAG TPA: GNAT family N-acetyltransferase [Acidimicrobiia bacterium]|nr:GNAT family N-acetyltransferase [Acidimicrobiia bacterium]